MDTVVLKKTKRELLQQKLTILYLLIEDINQKKSN